jgi:LPXTG-motif cell wall-anchored protein
LDLYSVNSGTNNKLYINPGQGGNYIKVIVKNDSNLYNYNARIEIDIDGNNDFSASGDIFVQYQTNSSYAGNNQFYTGNDSYGVFFGLGSDAACKYDVRIFLSGVSLSGSPSYSMENVCPNQTLTNPFDNVVPSISLNALPQDTTNSSTPTFIGTATETSGTVSSVEYQVDDTAGTWIACSADDGAFDEAEEAFTCTVSDPLSDDSHTIYVRATDSNGNTTLSGFELSYIFTVNTLPETGDFMILFVLGGIIILSIVCTLSFKRKNPKF